MAASIPLAPFKSALARDPMPQKAEALRSQHAFLPSGFCRFSQRRLTTPYLAMATPSINKAKAGWVIGILICPL